ncbi:hypothetical protein DFQ26_005138 [Actinomortierella ambigua]|nr:hypothetical protein DFQ26_005138 [Actinomortierella ambigua]
MASVMTGIVPLTQEGLITGGPALMVFVFALTGALVLMVVLSLAEISSGFPGVKGGLVEYTRRLSPPGHLWQRLAPWVAGWLHFLAYTMGAASVCFSFALFATAGVQIAQGTTPPRIVTVAFHIGAAIFCGIVNAFKIQLSLLSMIWHAVGTVIVLITVIAAQRDPPTITWVFTHFENGTGWTNNVYVCMLGFILGGFTFTGFDGPIHTEYNQPNAARLVPRGILVGFLSVLLMGEVLILTLLFAISDLPSVLEAEETGHAGLEIFYLLLGENGCLWMLVLFLGTFLFCAQGILLVASEIGHELAMLRALPGSAYFEVANQRGQPGRVGWLVTTIAGAVGLLYLVNETALIALTSVVAIELNIVYTLPALTRLIFPDPDHVRCPVGPFSLGRWSRLVDALAVGWAMLATIIFCFPTAYPITVEDMNYACFLLTITLAFIFGYWFYSGRHWYGLAETTTRRPGDQADEIASTTTTTTTKEAAEPVPERLDTLDSYGRNAKELYHDDADGHQHYQYFGDDVEGQGGRVDVRGVHESDQSPSQLHHQKYLAEEEEEDEVEEKDPKRRRGDPTSVPMGMQHFVLTEEEEEEENEGHGEGMARIGRGVGGGGDKQELDERGHYQHGDDVESIQVAR